jgi:hexosaminidase
VQYAGERCIVIVPEIEMPGHSAAIFRAYPELAGDGSPASTNAAAQPAMLQFLHPDHLQVFPFITDVLGEIAAISPAAYLHIGGDEAFGMPEDLYVRFIERARPIVSQLGKKLIAWQEAARAGLGAGDIGQYWIQFDPAMLESFDIATLPDDLTLPDGSALTPEMMGAIMEIMRKSGGDVPKLLAAGADVLISISTRNYLDTPYAEASSDPAQQAEVDRLGMKFYPATTVAEFFDWDPLTVRDDLPEDRIAGVEAAIWCETIANFRDLCFMLLPRLAGNGERGWSARNSSQWDDYRQRLAAQPVFWRHRDLNFFRSSLVDWES